MHADNATYDIIYDDGKVDHGLAADCVRRFVPFSLNEMVQVTHTTEGEPHETRKKSRVQVVEVYNGGEFYDLASIDGHGTLYRRIPPSQIRRIYEPSPRKLNHNQREHLGRAVSTVRDKIGAAG